MQRRALLLGLSAAACGPKERPVLPSAPAVRTAPELIPSDLDLVLRLDLAQVKAALGAEALALLSRQVLAAGGNRAADELVIRSLLAADLVYLGYRPSPTWTPIDRVLALQGRFEPLRPTPSGFSGPTDLGADVRYWESRAPTPRDGVARIYALGERGLVFVSEAEIDAVERILDGLGSSRRLDPPEEGTLAIAARPALLARAGVGGTLADMLNDAKTLQLVVHLDSDGVTLAGALALDSAEKARSLAAAAQLVVSHLDERLGAKASLRAEDERVLLSAKVDRTRLARAVACVGSRGPDCDW
jgi:hypothetical protein